MNRPAALIVAGALASIATSKSPTDWTVADEVGISAATLDDAEPLLRYTFRAERRGTFTGEEEGYAQAWVQVVAGSAQHVVTAELRSLTHPDVMPATQSLPADEFQRFLVIDAFFACSSDPCVEDFELTVSRNAGSVLPAVTVQGSAAAYVSGAGTQPSDAAISVTTMGPL